MNLQFIPAAGTLVTDPWEAQAFAQAQNSLGELDSEFDASSGGVAQADAVVTFADGHSSADAITLEGGASSEVDIPGATTAQASSAGVGTLFTFLTITGGTGSVDVDFSLDVSGLLHVFTDLLGQLAETEIILTLLLDGDPVLFLHSILSIGPDSEASESVSETLSASRTLTFDTPYFLLIQGDSESMGINVPEPSVGALLLFGLGLLAARSRMERRPRSLLHSRRDD